MMKYLILFLCLPFSMFTQKSSELDALSKRNDKKSFPMLKELLSIPNDAFYPGDIEKNVVHGSDAPETASFEISYFLNRFEIIR